MITDKLGKSCGDLKVVEKKKILLPRLKKDSSRHLQTFDTQKKTRRWRQKKTLLYKSPPQKRDFFGRFFFHQKGDRYHRRQNFHPITLFPISVHSLSLSGQKNHVPKREKRTPPFESFFLMVGWEPPFVWWKDCWSGIFFHRHQQHLPPPPPRHSCRYPFYGGAGVSYHGGKFAEVTNQFEPSM